ncbi:MAG: 2-enoyl thioester reductase domain-containing protein [Verrucomicrobiota bacterium]
MSHTYSVATFGSFGDPAEVIELKDKELPKLGPGEVLVKMLIAPINPADLNMIQGVYGVKPELPAVPGIEGVGEIQEVGEGVYQEEVFVGALVKLPVTTGSWCQRAVVFAGDLLVFPHGLSPEQASMMYVNPPTAWCMLNHFVKLKPGDWVIQNAANSAVGRSVIQICAACGIQTINVVRRDSLIDELKSLGADIVILDSSGFHKKVRKELGDDLPKLGLNAVGGENAASVAKCLAPGGIHVTYGAMGMKPVSIANSLLIFADMTFKGFWMTRWYNEASSKDIDVMMQSLASLVVEGKLKLPIEKIYDLSLIKEAISHAQCGGRAGKILLRLS